jgi:carbamoyltransferase
MYILGIHTGHDAGAALFKDQQLAAFCKEERLSRIKNPWRRVCSGVDR